MSRLSAMGAWRYRAPWRQPPNEWVLPATRLVLVMSTV
jgi:hypothetical protein